MKYGIQVYTGVKGGNNDDFEYSYRCKCKSTWVVLHKQLNRTQQ